MLRKLRQRLGQLFSVPRRKRGFDLRTVDLDGSVPPHTQPIKNARCFGRHAKGTRS